MLGKPIPPRIVLGLTVLGLILLLTNGIVLALAALLAAMGDAVGQRALQWIALGCSIPLAVDLILLLLALGANSVGEPPEPPEIG